MTDQSLASNVLYQAECILRFWPHPAFEVVTLTKAQAAAIVAELDRLRQFEDYAKWSQKTYEAWVDRLRAEVGK